MKHGKRPSRAQKEFIAFMGFNYENWLVVKNTVDFIQIVHRQVGQSWKITKDPLGRVRV